MAMQAIDRAGRIVEAGDTVVFGADNGSRLYVGIVTKVTPQFVWMSVKRKSTFNKQTYYSTYRRAYERVCKIEAVK